MPTNRFQTTRCCISSLNASAGGQQGAPPPVKDLHKARRSGGKKSHCYKNTGEKNGLFFLRREGATCLLPALLRRCPCGEQSVPASCLQPPPPRPRQEKVPGKSGLQMCALHLRSEMLPVLHLQAVYRLKRGNASPFQQAFSFNDPCLLIHQLRVQPRAITLRFACKYTSWCMWV